MTTSARNPLGIAVLGVLALAAIIGFFMPQPQSPPAISPTLAAISAMLFRVEFFFLFCFPPKRGRRTPMRQLTSLAPPVIGGRPQVPVPQDPPFAKTRPLPFCLFRVCFCLISTMMLSFYSMVSRYCSTSSRRDRPHVTNDSISSMFSHTSEKQASTSLDLDHLSLENILRTRQYEKLV